MSRQEPIQNVELIRYIAVLHEYLSLKHDVTLAFVPLGEDRPVHVLAEQAKDLEKMRKLDG